MLTPTLRFKTALLLIIPAFLLLAGCDAFSSDEDESGKVAFTGQVLNDQTNNPVPGAFVRILPFDLLFEADLEGLFSFEVEIDSTMEVEITAAADGYASQTLPIFAIAGRTIDVPSFHINPLVEAATTSGQASNIILVAQSLETIGVRESGSEELSSLTFQLADSSGNPVNLNKSVDVRFSFGVHPNGGEFIAPALAQSDNNGIVNVNLSSGTRAGVVQVIAQANVNGKVIRSQPIAVTIHGGLPDQSHFSLGPKLRNFPGLNTFGLQNQINVIVGDKYSNPVREGSAVYFNTSHGIIEGSTLTDDQGGGLVNLISANPLPPDGIAHLQASTADDQQTLVTDITPVIFSGTPVITVSHGTAAVNQFYSYTVMDYNGNPLAGGTNISVELTGTAVKLGGNTSVDLSDSNFSGGIDYEHVVRGPGITEFSFVVAEDIDPLAPETPVVNAIVIKTEGPNGTLEIVLGSGGIPFSRTNGIRTIELPDGRYQFELEDPNPVETR